MTKAQPERLLPRNERIREAAKIIDENRSQKVGGCTDSIANMLDRQDWRCTGIKALRRTESGSTPPWEPRRRGGLHDLRRTFVTGLADLGIRPDVIEMAVNHAGGLRGGGAGVYNKSELLPERRAALEHWAAHVEGLVAGKATKVVLHMVQK
jgi:hypothetical protein